MDSISEKMRQIIQIGWFFLVFFLFSYCPLPSSFNILISSIWIWIFLSYFSCHFLLIIRKCFTRVPSKNCFQNTTLQIDIISIVCCLLLLIIPESQSISILSVFWALIFSMKKILTLIKKMFSKKISQLIISFLIIVSVCHYFACYYKLASERDSHYFNYFTKACMILMKGSTKNNNENTNSLEDLLNIILGIGGTLIIIYLLLNRTGKEKKK